MKINVPSDLTKEQKAEIAAVFINIANYKIHPILTEQILGGATSIANLQLNPVQVKNLRDSQHPPVTQIVTKEALMREFPEGVGCLNYYQGRPIKINLEDSWFDTYAFEKNYPGVFNTLMQELVKLGFLNNQFDLNVRTSLMEAITEEETKCASMKSTHPEIGDRISPLNDSERQEMDSLYYKRDCTDKERIELKQLTLLKEYVDLQSQLEPLLANARAIIEDSDANMYDEAIAAIKLRIKDIKGAYNSEVKEHTFVKESVYGWNHTIPIHYDLDADAGPTKTFSQAQEARLKSLEAMHARTTEEDARFKYLDTLDDYTTAYNRLQDLRDDYLDAMKQIAYVRGLLEAAEQVSYQATVTADLLEAVTLSGDENADQDASSATGEGSKIISPDDLN